MKVRLLFLLSILYSVSVYCQREIHSFNDGWQFLPADSVKTASPGDWQEIQLPHTWNQDAYATKDYKRGRCWYRKVFLIPESLRNKDLYIRFDAVNSYAEVYLNGSLLATHSGGYSAFNVKLPSGKLNAWDTLMVLVDNRNINIPPLSGDFTIFGGIYRNTWLVTLEKEHFDMDNYGSPGIFISTPKVNSRDAIIHIKGSVNKVTDKPLKVKVQLLDNGGNILSKEIVLHSRNFTINNLKINEPHLWSPDDPHLYKARFTLLRNDRIVDTLEIPFGLRWFSADTKNGFMLNGKPLKLMGTNRHQDKYPYGIAIPESVNREDMRLIKNMGANFVRLAHYQQDDEVLKACDRLGLIVWEEVPVVDIIGDNETFRRNAESMLTEMIRQHYNHPSVMFWGFMNETINGIAGRIEKDKQTEFYGKTVSLAKHLEDLLKREDKSRLSVMACGGTTLNNKIGLSGITDVLGWNLYQGWYTGQLEGFEDFVDKENTDFPGRPLIISEFGAGSDQRLHSLRPEIFDFSIEYQQKYLEHYLPKILKRKFIIGAAEWNFIDFNVASRQESMPRTNNKGLVYNNRTPKDVYYYFQAFLRKDTAVVRIASHDWTLRNAVSDKDSFQYPVKVYSNQPKVQLIVNDRKLEIKKTENYSLVWNVYLQKGINKIEAVVPDKSAKDRCEIFLSFSPLSTSTPQIRNWDLAINIGSNCEYYDGEDGKIWNADKPYTTGSWGYVDGDVFRKTPGRIGTTTQIENTWQTPLFQTARENITGYRIDAPPGLYEIELGFADLYNAPARQVYDLAKTSENIQGLNMFNVFINDKLSLEKFSPSLVSNINSAVNRRIIFFNQGKGIYIRFQKISGHTFLNSLRVIKKG